MSTSNGSFRDAVEQRSAPVVLFLYGLPRWTLLASVFALLAIGMIGTGWVGAAGLLALAVFLGWFAFLTWPALGVPARALRIVTLGVLVGLAILHMIRRT